MQAYDSAVHYPVLFAAVLIAHDGDLGTLATVRSRLFAAGVEWPQGWNENNGEPSLTIDRDVIRARETIGKGRRYP